MTRGVFQIGGGEAYGDASLILLVRIFNEESMEESMKDGCDNNRDYDEKNNPAKKGVETGEHLTFIGLQSRYRPHARQDHRSV